VLAFAQVLLMKRQVAVWFPLCWRMICVCGYVYVFSLRALRRRQELEWWSLERELQA
jgi:hypothetical protein